MMSDSMWPTKHFQQLLSGAEGAKSPRLQAFHTLVRLKNQTSEYHKYRLCVSGVGILHCILMMPDLAE